MKTDQLIEALAQDTAVRWKIGKRFAVAVLLGVLIAGSILFVGIGVRPDVVMALETVRFPFKFVVTLALAIAAVGAALRASRPDLALGMWTAALIAAPVLLLAGVIAEMMTVPETAWGARMIGTNSLFCLSFIPLMAIGPLACILLAMRHGAPSHPGLAGGIAGLAASGISASFYAAHCPDDSPFFVATWYSLATLMIVAAGYFAGRRVLRW